MSGVHVRVAQLAQVELCTCVHAHWPTPFAQVELCTYAEAYHSGDPVPDRPWPNRGSQPSGVGTPDLIGLCAMLNLLKKELLWFSSPLLFVRKAHSV